MPHRLPATLLASLLAFAPPAHAALHRTATAFPHSIRSTGALPVNAITHKAILQARLRTASRPLLSRQEVQHALLLVIVRLLAPAFRPVISRFLPTTFR